MSSMEETGTAWDADDIESMEDIEEALGHLAHTASRCFPVVGNESYVTKWDKIHQQINTMLDARDRLLQGG